MNNSNNINEKLNKNGKIEPNKSKVPPALSNLSNKMPNMPKPNKNNDDNKTENQKGTEETKNKNNSAGVDLKSTATNMALGAAANQEGAVGAAARTAIKVKKVKTAWTIATAVGPFVLPVLGGILVFLLIAAAALIPTMYIGEHINEITESISGFGDKFANLITFNGFETSTAAVTKKIKDEKNLYKNYKCIPDLNKKYQEGVNPDSEDVKNYINPDIAAIDATPCISGNFDEGILISTLQVENVVDYSAYDKTNEEMGQGDYEEERNNTYNKVTVDTDEVNKFYEYADLKWLGDSSFDNVIDERALLYNIIDYRMERICVPKKDKFSYYAVTGGVVVSQIFANFGVENISDFIKNFASLFIPVNQISDEVDLIRSMSNFKKQGMDYRQFLSLNASYNANKSIEYTDKNYGVLRMLWNSIETNDTVCDDDYTSVPILVRFMNYNNYVNYLKEVYIPMRYFNCDSCKKMNLTDEAKEQITKDTIADILDQRNAYFEGIGQKSDIYLVVDKFGNYTIDGDTGVYSGGVYPVGTSGTGWKQGDSNWGSFKLAASSDTTMSRIGCYVTSIATVIANSGTKINGSMFDPGVLASVIKQNGGFDYTGSLSSYAWTSIAPNFVSEGKQSCDSYAANCGNTISQLLSQGKFVVVNVPNHFVAVVGADENGIIISDPAKGPTTEYLSKYNGVIQGLRVFHKTD